MKRHKIHSGDKVYCVGSSSNDFTDGPFPSLDVAFVEGEGKQGHFIWRVTKDGSSTKIYKWSEMSGEWIKLQPSDKTSTASSHEPEVDNEQGSVEVSNEVERAYFENGLLIDKHALDDALMVQPGLLREVGDKQALALSVRDQAKDYVKQVEAELYLEVRKRYERMDKKVTENIVNAEVDCHPRRKKAVAQYMEAIEQAARWENLFESYRSRGFALGELNKLFLGGFYAKDYAEGNAQQAERRQTQDKIKQGYRDRNKRAR